MIGQLALAALIALAGAGPALAHARLLHAIPRVGSTVKIAPRDLELSFSESIDVGGSSVTLLGPSGRVATGPLTRDPADPRIVHVPVKRALPPGTYRVEWGMTSTDTHHTDGDFSFKVAR
ncbi:copper resistance protein CopC [Phenylobacterium sp.]|uniref:copper resistance protein CopC n=1 Tax=Phenylobacterium sp. TaxID=1871053 RepID=UPI00261D0782|nr:copper resistance protein CopC [Phenylobacterium sp.]